MGHSLQHPPGLLLLVRGRPGPPSLSSRRFLGETPLLQIPILPALSSCCFPRQAWPSALPSSVTTGTRIQGHLGVCCRPQEASVAPPPPPPPDTHTVLRPAARPAAPRRWEALGRKPRSASGRWAGRGFPRRGCRLSLWFAATVGRVGGIWPARGVPRSASAKPTCQAGAEDRTPPSWTSA